MTRLLPALAGLLLLTTPAAAQDFEKGSEAYERGDYATARQEFRLFAEQGDDLAQFLVGSMYVTGRGGPVDNVQAHIWLSLAAEQGYELSAKIRDKVAEVMTPTQIAEAERMARKWMERHSK